MGAARVAAQRVAGITLYVTHDPPPRPRKSRAVANQTWCVPAHQVKVRCVDTDVGPLGMLKGRKQGAICYRWQWPGHENLISNSRIHKARCTWRGRARLLGGLQRLFTMREY
jgi:hypothetical protein